MQISFQKALSFYLTGRTILPENILSSENTASELTRQELDDMEISSQAEYQRSESEGFQFSDKALNLKADFNTVHGQFRMAGLGVINSFFSGIGAGFGSKLNFLSGLSLAGLSLGVSFLKKIPFLSTKFSIMGFGGNLIRGPLHIFDSIFSTIGEQGSKYTLPSLLAGGVSVLSLVRTVLEKDNKEFTLPFDTVSGTLGRTAIHHMDSMLASKAAQISNSHHTAGSFLASSLTTLGLLAPDSVKKKVLPWNTHEGFIAQGGSNFLDSLFSNIGNSFSCLLNSSRNIAIATGGIALGMPVLGTILNAINYQIPFGTLEGRLVRGIFHAPENLVFNVGTILGNSTIGIPLSLGFAGLTYLTCVSKQGKNLLKNFDISRDKIGGLIQRLPFHLLYSMISASGVKLSKFIPAPILTIIGPAVSFQLGEIFKNIDSKFDDLKGLMLRNSVHLWETILARAAYRTGRMITGTHNEETSSGSILSDGRWLSDDGRIVPTMAIGKQTKDITQNNLLNIVLSALGGVGCAIGGLAIAKYFMKTNSEPLRDEDAKAVAVEVCHGKPFASPKIEQSVCTGMAA
ncbi:MAG: hypothetical protein A3B68_09330 [Candidatus Melainabacteria bacterium RIFCSPHIGHO2_02_FULL_34_12]|nr:MAG: hypothetical protein A3B68_09330 [Candidatus Melainabacteria bacterium RIFCSPHIGHO2_02_FULL_34_12]